MLFTHWRQQYHIRSEHSISEGVSYSNQARSSKNRRGLNNEYFPEAMDGTSKMKDPNFTCIDFHTHLIPDRYLREMLERKQEMFPGTGRPPSDYLEIGYPGSVKGLLTSMARSGIWYSVVLPVARTPDKVESTNQWMRSVALKNPQLIPFGTIHQDYTRIEEELEKVSQSGFKGIKVHLFYQSQNHNPRPSFLKKNFLLIPKNLERLGLILVVDTYFPWDHENDPETLEELIALSEMFPKLRIVAAHMGSAMNWDVVTPFYGRDIFFDISFTLGILSNDIIESIIKTHGADKILFGSDFPFRTPEKEIERFMALEIPKEDRIKILNLNAQNLLGLRKSF